MAIKVYFQTLLQDACYKLISYCLLTNVAEPHIFNAAPVPAKNVASNIRAGRKKKVSLKVVVLFLVILCDLQNIVLKK
jgi:hypothetical protein